MVDFEALPPHRLDRLSDEALVDYVAAAHDAGDQDAERAGLGLLAYAFEPQIRVWVGSTVPTEDIEDVVIVVQENLIRASFDGKVIGQMGALLKTISQRRAADYWRDRERRGDVQGNKGRLGDDGDRGQGPIPEALDEGGFVETMEAVDRVLATRNPLHQKVIRLYGPNVAGFMDLPADEVKAIVDGDDSDDTVSVDNVAKIWSRFVKELRGELNG